MTGQDSSPPSKHPSYRRKRSQISTNHQKNVFNLSKSISETSVSTSGGKSRLKKHKKPSHRKSNSEQKPLLKQQTERPNPERPPSKSAAALRSKSRPSSPNQFKSGDFAAGDDYIAFESSESQEDDRAHAQVSRVDKGKGRDRAPPEPHVGNKRSADQMEYGVDGYANKKQRMDAAARLTPWVNDVNWDKCRNLAEMMDEEVKAYVNYISPTSREHEVRGMVITTITRAIENAWPDARVSPFGSYETRLYLPLGDIDLVIESSEMERHDKKRVLYHLAQLLRRANITDNVTVIAKAKVPIIKFVTIHGRFAVDISLNQSNGIKAGRVINQLLKEMPALRSLIMIIKLFLSQRSMNEVYTGGLGSYAIVCMAVSFLQMHPKIRAGEIDPLQNLGVLVMEFFELYGHHFNYENTGISLRDGGTYFSKTARGWDDPKNPALLSIEDPLDASNDISKNSYNMVRVRKTLAGAHEVLSAAAFMRGRILAAKARGDHIDTTYNNPSILCSVMGVTQQTLNHRKMVRQLFQQGTLQNLLGLPLHPHSPISLNSNLSNDDLRRQSVKAVESAWNEVDSGSTYDYMEEQSARLHSSSDAEEESRYTATNDPNPSKRRRLNPLIEEPIYVEDSEEADESDAAPTTVHLEGTLKVAPGKSATSKLQVDAEKAKAKRAYWASKGIPGGDLEDSDY